MSIRTLSDGDVEFICGYEAGSLGYTLSHQLTDHNVKYIILTPSTMPVTCGKKKANTERRDVSSIAKCLAYRTYSPVYVPTEEDEQVREYIRMYI